MNDGRDEPRGKARVLDDSHKRLAAQESQDPLADKGLRVKARAPPRGEIYHRSLIYDKRSQEESR